MSCQEIVGTFWGDAPWGSFLSERERGRARQRNGGQVYTLDKRFGFLLIHHLTVIIPCPLICEMCRLGRRFLWTARPPFFWRAWRRCHIQGRWKRDDLSRLKIRPHSHTSWRITECKAAYYVAFGIHVPFFHSAQEFKNQDLTPASPLYRGSSFSRFCFTSHF